MEYIDKYKDWIVFVIVNIVFIAIYTAFPDNPKILILLYVATDALLLINIFVVKKLVLKAEQEKLAEKDSE